MNNPLITAIIGILLVASVGGFVYWQKQQANMPQETAEDQNNQTEDTGDTTAPATTTTSTPAPAGITAAQVGEHNTRTSCWSSINGNVYDLTSWIPKHPGGEQAILQLCGTDGSAKFNGKHGGAEKQAMVLAGFKIGALAK